MKSHARAAQTSNRRGFTLVELLISISIIAILMTFMLGAVFVAQETARRDRTEALVSKLHNVIIDRWESYRTRRVNITIPAPTAIQRLYGRRDLMRMEMPDRYEDLMFASTAASILRSSYTRRIEAARVKFNAARSTSYANAAAFITAELGNGANPNESAECLYLLITASMSADERAEFTDKDVGDTNENFMPEYVDAWGTPIHFLRWAPGFLSDVQVRDPVDHHDPFDPAALENGDTANGISRPSGGLPKESGESDPPYWGFATLPLIYSAGPDRQHGLYEHLAATPETNATRLAKNRNPYCRYMGDTTYVWRGEGRPDPSTGDLYHFDNIHNHNPLGVR